MTNDQEKDNLIDYYLSLPPAKRSELFPDTAQAAGLVGVSQRAIQQWVAEGTIQAVKIGRKYYVDFISLKKHLSKNQM